MTYDPRMWLSVSQLKSVAKCGRAFSLSRIEKVPEQQFAWNCRGTAAHRAIEEFEKDRSVNALEYYVDIAWPEALAKITEQYPANEEYWGTTPRVKSVERDLELRKEDGLKQVQNYVTRAMAEQDLWSVEHSEVPFTLEPTGKDFIIRGYIDQIILWSDGDRTLRDLKTSSNDDHESKTQLATYRLGAIKALGIDIRFGDLWYTKLDRPSKPMDLWNFSEEYIMGEFQKLYEVKKQGLYLANPSIKNCFSCPVSKHCIESMNTNE